MHITKYQRDIDNCRFCWMCRHVCTVSRETNEEGMSSRARGFILSLILRGITDYSMEVAEVIYSCCLCGYCKYWCKGGFDIPAFVKAARQDLVDRGYVPEKIIELKDSLVNHDNPYGLKKNQKDSDLERLLKLQPEVGPTLLLFGSAVLYKSPTIGVSALEVLKTAGINIATLRDEITSGFELYCLGYTREARKKIELLLKQVENSHCREIITLSPEDYYCLTQQIKDLGYNLGDINIYYITEYMVKLLEQGKIKLTKSLKRRITYHDSNYLARYCHIIDSPRKLCQSLPGVEYKETLWTKEEAHSIGNAIMMYVYPDLCQKMIRTRIKDVIEADVDVLVTSSGEDKSNFLASTDKPPYLKVMDIVELINEAL